MLGLSVLLNGWAIWKLRVWNPSGEPIMQRDAAARTPEEKDRCQGPRRPGAVRPVWAQPDPLARDRHPRLRPAAAAGEARLLRRARPDLLLRPVPSLTAATVAAAYGLVPVAILSLLLVSAQAVTAITSERDTARSTCCWSPT